MTSRKKRLIKQKESLLERAQEHRIKAETFMVKKDTLPGYWLGEAERFEKQAKEREELLKKVKKK